MGLNSTTGAFASLTNVRSSAPRPAGGPSRGALVLGALEQPAEAAAEAARYSTFNLWHGSAFPDVSARFTRSRFSNGDAANGADSAAGEPTAAAPSGGQWATVSEVVTPGEVVAYSNEGDARCGDAPWGKTRRLRAGVAELLRSLPEGRSASELREALARLLSESMDAATLAAVGGTAAFPASSLAEWQEGRRAAQRHPPGQPPPPQNAPRPQLSVSVSLLPTHTPHATRFHRTTAQFTCLRRALRRCCSADRSSRAARAAKPRRRMASPTGRTARPARRCFSRARARGARTSSSAACRTSSRRPASGRAGRCRGRRKRRGRRDGCLSLRRSGLCL